MAIKKINTKKLLKDNTMLIALIAVMALFQILIISADKGSLLAPANISNLISQNAYVVILAVGMLLCILTGGNIDLSVGSIVCLVGAVAGVLTVKLGLNIYFTIAICILLGIGLGAWQGYFIAYMRIPAFIVTLSGMLLFRGLANVILNGMTISPFPSNYLRLFTSYLPGSDASDAFKLIFTMTIGIVACIFLIYSTLRGRSNKVSKGYDVDPMNFTLMKIALLSAVILWFASLLGRHKGLPVVLIWLSVIVAIYSYFTSKTTYGRHFYAMGGNEKAAILSGIDTNKILFSAYTNMGFLSAIAALVCVARFNSATPSAGNAYELDAIGACFVGGASAYGGTGTIAGSIIGAILMGVLNNGMSILGIDANWQKAVKGLVLLAAVLFDVMSKKKQSAK